MSPNVDAALQEKVRTLSPEQQKEVLAFIEKLKNTEKPEKELTPLQKLGRMIDKSMADVPPEAFDEIPTDGSINHDHYLYGAPKK